MARGHVFTGTAGLRVWLATDTGFHGEQAPLLVEEMSRLTVVSTRTYKVPVQATFEEVLAVYKLTTDADPEAPA